jgi:putative ABC transport system permease protein
MGSGFMRWVLLSNIFAWPLAWLFVRNWLNNFAFRVTPQWYLFIGASLIALLIAVLTISYQSFLAARKDPVDSLRYE